MTYVTWAIAIWGGALAYTMVGALVWRLLRRMMSGDRGLRFWCIIWPVFAAIMLVAGVIKLTIYTPFRAVAKAIAKPGGTA